MRSKAVNGRTWRRGWGGSKIQEPGFDSNQEFLESTDSPWPHLSLVFLPVRNHARSGGRCFVRVVASQLLQSEPGSCGCRNSPRAAQRGVRACAMDRNALWPYSLALARVRSTRAAFLIRRGSILTCIYVRPLVRHSGAGHISRVRGSEPAWPAAAGSAPRCRAGSAPASACRR